MKREKNPITVHPVFIFIRLKYYIISVYVIPFFERYRRIGCHDNGLHPEYGNTEIGENWISFSLHPLRPIAPSLARTRREGAEPLRGSKARSFETGSKLETKISIVSTTSSTSLSIWPTAYQMACAICSALSLR